MQQSKNRHLLAMAAIPATPPRTVAPPATPQAPRLVRLRAVRPRRALVRRLFPRPAVVLVRENPLGRHL